MINTKVKKLIYKTVDKMIEKSGDEIQIRKLLNKHSAKLHFIPTRYRIFGGMLQSLNIQFGNFIEELMKEIVLNEEKYEILDKYSGKKSNKFYLSNTNDAIIDEYISRCQTSEIDCDSEFENLKERIISNANGEANEFKHDIDLLFKNLKDDIIYYVEIKYNDDHNTGKFVDINRKLIKTYAYLVKELNIKNKNKLKPILFYFNNKKMKGNIYLPEKDCIYRGKRFFDEFLSIKYEDVDTFLSELSESDENIKKFNDLYEAVMNF